MPTLRIIPRLEVKSEYVVKGIRMEGLRVVGQPGEMSARYDADGADEILVVNDRHVLGRAGRTKHTSIRLRPRPRQLRCCKE